MSVLRDLGYEHDDLSEEAQTLRQSLGPKRVLIPKIPDKGDCLVESCCKLLRFARALGHEVQDLKLTDHDMESDAGCSVQVQCSICLQTWDPPALPNGQCPDCGIVVINSLTASDTKKPKRRAASPKTVAKKGTNEGARSKQRYTDPSRRRRGRVQPGYAR